MVRDFDLIRRILLDVQAAPAGGLRMTAHYPGEYDQATVDGHVALLIDAGLLEGKVLRVGGRIANAVIVGLTWQGHDFIDSARDDTLWARAKKSVLKPAAAVTFDALLQWLKQGAMERIGLS